MPQREARSLVEPDSLIIRFRHRKRDGLETRCQQRFRTPPQKQAAKSPAAERRRDAELSNVRDLWSDARTQHHADQRTASPIAQHPGEFRFKDAASGKPHDVVQKAQGTVQRSVLVVDLGIRVAHIACVDQLARCLVILCSPGRQF